MDLVSEEQLNKISAQVSILNPKANILTAKQSRITTAFNRFGRIFCRSIVPPVPPPPPQPQHGFKPRPVTVFAYACAAHAHRLEFSITSNGAIPQGTACLRDPPVGISVPLMPETSRILLKRYRPSCTDPGSRNGTAVFC